MCRWPVALVSHSRIHESTNTIGLLLRSTSRHHTPTHSHLCLLITPLLPVLSPSLLPLKNSLPISVQLQLRDHDFARCDTQWHALPVRLLAHNSLDVNHIFQTIDGEDLAFAAFVRTAGDEDFVVFAEGDGFDLVGSVRIKSRSCCVGSQ